MATVCTDPIHITPAARTYLQQMLEEASVSMAFLAVQRAGCSGYRYVLHYGSAPVQEGDAVVTLSAIHQLVVGRASLVYLLGTKVDYRVDPLHGELVFENPQARAHCGCGESFFLVPGVEPPADNQGVL